MDLRDPLGRKYYTSVAFQLDEKTRLNLVCNYLVLEILLKKTLVTKIKNNLTECSLLSSHTIHPEKDKARFEEYNMRVLKVNFS